MATEKWYFENKTRLNELARQRNFRYYNNDENFRLKTRLRVILRSFVKGHNKTSIIEKYIGCNRNQLLQWLQITAFVNNYYDFDINDFDGNYNIDHKIPITAFDLRDPNEVKKAYHWSNLQILSARDNKIKYNNNELTYDKVRNNLSAKLFEMMYIKD